MSETANTVLRGVVLQSKSTGGNVFTGRLLAELGYEVLGTQQSGDALQHLTSELTDLLVVDLPADERLELLTGFQVVPADCMPRLTVFFGDPDDEDLLTVRGRFAPGRAFVFHRPLHMHGLIKLLKKGRGSPEIFVV